MKIISFWVVTRPSKISTLRDILFKSTWRGIRLQFLGGLKSGDIVGVWTSKEEAEKVAKRLLKKVK